jgi:predicted nuclease of restriction endonuclease-like RecB superfamily
MAQALSTLAYLEKRLEKREQADCPISLLAYRTKLKNSALTICAALRTYFKRRQTGQ